MIYLLPKILGGACLAGAIPVVTITASFFFDKGHSIANLPETKLEKDKDFEDSCYVLGTKNNQKQKLLVCEDPSNFIKEIYYLLKEEESNRTYYKAQSVIKKSNSDHLFN